MRRSTYALLFVCLAPVHPAVAFSHDAWARVLEAVVDEQGLVDYEALRDHRADLDSYLALLRAHGPESTPAAFPQRADALAYYLNAYNALVFDEVLALGPGATTVWGITGSGYGFFSLTKVELDGRSISLKALEDDLVRAQFQDPRIHAALNCASIGCPRLPREPFLPTTLDHQLDAAMREFVNSERGVRLDSESKTIELSKIFDWFADDFLGAERRAGNSEPTILDAIDRWRDEPLPRDWQVRYGEYDKRLNQRTPADAGHPPVAPGSPTPDA